MIQELGLVSKETKGAPTPPLWEGGIKRVTVGNQNP